MEKQKRKTVSVALAVYNGEKHLREQLGSMMPQLKEEDEIVLSLDPSADGSEALIRSLCEQDARIRCVSGPGKGVIKNFENAIKHCKNEIIFLSDQDDVWAPDKVDAVLPCFEDPGVMVALHDAKIVDAQLADTGERCFALKNVRPGVFRNILKNSYMGCCMAFRRSLCGSILPFPDKLPMHDQWIGIIGELEGKSCFLDKPLLYYRRHGNNVTDTKHAKLRQMIAWRLQILREVAKFKRRKP